MTPFDEMFGRSSNPRQAYENYAKWLDSENMSDLQKKNKEANASAATVKLVHGRLHLQVIITLLRTVKSIVNVSLVCHVRLYMMSLAAPCCAPLVYK